MGAAPATAWASARPARRRWRGRVAATARFLPSTSPAQRWERRRPARTGRAWAGRALRWRRARRRTPSFFPPWRAPWPRRRAAAGSALTAELTVRAYRSTPAFRDATLAPGWVAAFTEGDRIAVQPLRTLAARKLLASTLLHEFLHALVEERATAQTPLWLREGLVEAWSGEAFGNGSPTLRLLLVNGWEQVDPGAGRAEAGPRHKRNGVGSGPPSRRSVRSAASGPLWPRAGRRLVALRRSAERANCPPVSPSFTDACLSSGSGGPISAGTATSTFSAGGFWRSNSTATQPSSKTQLPTARRYVAISFSTTCQICALTPIRSELRQRNGWVTPPPAAPPPPRPATNASSTASESLSAKAAASPTAPKLPQRE